MQDCSGNQIPAVHVGLLERKESLRSDCTVRAISLKHCFQTWEMPKKWIIALQENPKQRLTRLHRGHCDLGLCKTASGSAPLLIWSQSGTGSGDSS